MNRHMKTTLGRAQTPGGGGGGVPDMVKVYLSEGESGWVKVVGHGVVQVMNIPLGGRFNIDDVVDVDVEAMEKDPYQALQGTITERIYPVRTAISYPKVSDFYKIAKQVEKLGGKIEGFMEPFGKKSGLLALAALSESHPLLIVRALDLRQAKDWRPNFLEA
jgi:hypothetical protein